MKDGPLWSRVSRRVWRSTDFRDMGPLPPSAPTLWFYLLSGEHNRTIPGLFVLGVGTMCDDLRWPMAAVRKHLATLIEKQHVKMDPVTNLVWLPKALDHNLPDNPNMVVGWKRDWQCMPACALKDEAREALRERLRQMPPKVQKDSAGNVIPPPSMTPYSDSFAVALGERSPNPSPNPSGKPPKDRRGNDRGDQNPNGGGDVMGNVTPTVRDDLTGYVDLTEREREEGEKAKTPPRARTSEGARGPARESEAPEPGMVVMGKDSARSTAEQRPPLRLVVPPSIDPYDADAVIDAIADAEGSMFDPLAGSSDIWIEIKRRLRAYKVTVRIGTRMGELSAMPKKVWATWESLGDGMVRAPWLMGRATENGSRNGANLSTWIAVAKRSLADEERETAADEARLAAPRSAPAPEMSAADRAAAVERIRARRAEAPGTVPAATPAGAPEVTYG